MGNLQKMVLVAEVPKLTAIFAGFLRKKAVGGHKVHVKGMLGGATYRFTKVINYVGCESGCGYRCAYLARSSKYPVLAGIRILRPWGCNFRVQDVET